MSPGLSRRRLFSLLGRSLRGRTGATQAIPTVGNREAVAPAPNPEAPDSMAVIQGRYCLAYTSFCSICVERCPVPNAMQVERGIPMVAPDVCTGCGVCHDVCPAPVNAVLVMPRRRTSRFNSSPPATP